MLQTLFLCWMTSFPLPYSQMWYGRLLFLHIFVGKGRPELAFAECLKLASLRFWIRLVPLGESSFSLSPHLLWNRKTTPTCWLLTLLMLFLTKVKAASCHVLVQMRVCHVVRRNRNICGALYDRFIHNIEINRWIVQVSASKLTAGNMNLAVLTIPEEDRLFDWSNDECGILTSVDCHLFRYLKLTEAMWSKSWTVQLVRSITLNANPFISPGFLVSSSPFLSRNS